MTHLRRNAFHTEKNSAWVMRKAKVLAAEDLTAEEAARGWLPPCRLVDPLGGGGYSKQEYEMMERDRGKYLLYAAAVRNAVSDITAAKWLKCAGESASTQAIESREVDLQVLVPGCGRGRLIQFVLDAADSVVVGDDSVATSLEDGVTNSIKRQGINVRVWALDANPIAVSHCRRRFALDHRVTVVGPLAVTPGMKTSDLPPELCPRQNDGAGVGPHSPCHSCDLIVSELLGSFGDNEFMCACTQTLRKLFLRGGGGSSGGSAGSERDGDCNQEMGVMIPCDFSCYIAPVSCARPHGLLRSLNQQQESSDDPKGSGGGGVSALNTQACRHPLDAPYIMSLTEDAVVLGLESRAVAQEQLPSPPQQWGQRRKGCGGAAVAAAKSELLLPRVWGPHSCHEPKHLLEATLTTPGTLGSANRAYTTASAAEAASAAGNSRSPSPRSERSAGGRFGNSSSSSSSSTERGPLAKQESQEGGVVVVDGLVGYFSATLYGDIVVDSRPELFRDRGDDTDEALSSNRGGETSASAAESAAGCHKGIQSSGERDLIVDEGKPTRWATVQHVDGNDGGGCSGGSGGEDDGDDGWGPEENASGRNAMHWEATWFPLPQPLLIPSPDTTKLGIYIAQFTQPPLSQPPPVSTESPSSASAASSSSSSSSSFSTNVSLHPSPHLPEAEEGETLGKEYVAGDQDEMWYEWGVCPLPQSQEGPCHPLPPLPQTPAHSVLPATPNSREARERDSSRWVRVGGRHHSIRLGVKPGRGLWSPGEHAARSDQDGASAGVGKKREGGTAVDDADTSKALKLAILMQNAERWQSSWVKSAAMSHSGVGE